MKIHLTAASVILLAALLGPPPAAASPASEVEKYLSGLASWSADFTQTIDDGHGNVLRSAASRSATTARRAWSRPWKRQAW